MLPQFIAYGTCAPIKHLPPTHSYTAAEVPFYMEINPVFEILFCFKDKVNIYLLWILN